MEGISCTKKYMLSFKGALCVMCAVIVHSTYKVNDETWCRAIGYAFTFSILKQSR